MREIKFRAWELDTANIIIGSYIKEDGFYMENGKPICGKPCIRYFIQDEDNIKHEIAEDTLGQYTGLKDKNGIEIYEGDVVSLVDCEPSMYKIVWWENNFKYGVEYIGSDKTNWREENLEEFSSELIEVIGNIYENPELLEVEK